MAKTIVLRLGMVLVGMLLGYLLFSVLDGGEELYETKNNKTVQYWTCSMHPQVQQEENNACPLCGMDLVLGAETSGYPSELFSMSKEASAMAGVETYTVGSEKKSVSTLSLSGEIRTNGNTDAVQTSVYAGRLDFLSKNIPGEVVRKGERIGTVYSPELYSPQDKLVTAKSYRETHYELYRAARNTDGLWKLTDAEVEELFKNDDPKFSFPLVSDFNGIVLEVYAEKGNFYQEGAPLYKVSNLKTVWAMLDVYEHQLPLIKVGDSVGLSGPGISKKGIRGKIDIITPRVKHNERILSARVVINNTEGLLKPGMFVNAQVQTTQDKMIKIPKTAIIWTGKRSLVYRKPIEGEDVFELVEIELGTSYDDAYQVLEGLSKGDEIVSHGTFYIDAAAQLQGKPSMMNHTFQGADDKDILPRSNKDMESYGGNMALSGPEDVNKPLGELVQHYFLLKDAMVADNYKTAMTYVEEFNLKFTAVKKQSISNGESLDKELTKMSNSTDLKSLRSSFKGFSKALITMLKAQNEFHSTLYVQFCPMADNNSGALWLSAEKEIRNPYFGKQMLQCGSIRKILK
ncbi:efflux RND transporter periplasmic adaptor subunit [Maribacter sp. 2307ULW6-5]|uniref:efflux RND transporter periplasmic adaptor subunit n=1 Tax=Maribacter sp. 2307ULW6-5 TaxID=3386275 RepID=UPI0039BC77C8